MFNCFTLYFTIFQLMYLRFRQMFIILRNLIIIMFIVEYTIHCIVIQSKILDSSTMLLDRTEDLRENCLENGRRVSANKHQETHRCWRMSSSSSSLKPCTSSWLFLMSTNSLMNPTLYYSFSGTSLYLKLTSPGLKLLTSWTCVC